MALLLYLLALDGREPEPGRSGVENEFELLVMRAYPEFAEVLTILVV